MAQPKTILQISRNTRGSTRIPRQKYVLKIVLINLTTSKSNIVQSIYGKNDVELFQKFLDISYSHKINPLCIRPKARLLILNNITDKVLKECFKILQGKDIPFIFINNFTKFNLILCISKMVCVVH